MDIFQYVSDNSVLSPEQQTDFLVDFCIGYDYQELVEDPKNPGQMIPNPVTREAHANYWIMRFFKDTVNAVRRRRAQADVTWERLELE